VPPGSDVLGGAAGVLCTFGATDVVGDPWAAVPLAPPTPPTASGRTIRRHSWVPSLPPRWLWW